MHFKCFSHARSGGTKKTLQVNGLRVKENNETKITCICNVILVPKYARKSWNENFTDK